MCNFTLLLNLPAVHISPIYSVCQYVFVNDLYVLNDSGKEHLNNG